MEMLMRLYLFFALISSPLFSLPQGAVSISGETEVHLSSPETLEILASDCSIIEWSDFSIKTGETVRFTQPHAAASVLNRVMEAFPSRLMGNLEANGQVLLINPNGILVGKEATINMGSFIATTLDINETLFREKKEIAFRGSSLASIFHEGSIRTSDSAWLIASQVDQSGTIFSGTSCGVIASREARFTNEGLPQLPKDFTSSGSLAIVRGEITAPAIYVLGEMIDVESGARFDASDPFRGGKISIGGDLSSEIAPARIVYIGADVTLDASATVQGNGGEVFVYGEDSSQFYGSALASAGLNGGDGGLIEISSPGSVSYHGHVDTRAPRGRTGMFLLDPCDITIDMMGLGTSVPAFTPAYTPGVNADVSVDDITDALLTSNVSLNTSPGVGGAGDILWLEGFPAIYTSTFSLTLNADNDITILSDINNTDVGDIFMNAGGFVTIGDPANTSTVIVESQGNVDIECTTGFLLTCTNPSALTASVIANGGMATINVTNGDIFIEALNAQNSGVFGKPVVMTAPQGAITVTCDSTGTTGILGSTDSMTIIARDDITFFCGGSGRNEGGVNSITGNMSLIQSTTGSVLLQNPSGQRLRYMNHFPLTIDAALDFIFEGGGIITLLQTSLSLGPPGTTYPLIINAGRDILITSNGGPGPNIQASNLTATAGRDIIHTNNGGFVAGIAVTGTGSASFIAGRDFSVLNTLSGNTTMTIAKNTSIQAGGNVAFNGSSTGNINYTTTGTMQIQAGGNVGVSCIGGNTALTNLGLQVNAGGNVGFFSLAPIGNATDTTTGNAQIIAGGSITYQGDGMASTSATLGLLLQAGGSIFLKNNSLLTTAGTSMLFIANSDIILFNGSTIDMTAPLVAGATVTFVVDNAFPVRPLFGTGGFFQDVGAVVFSVQRPPIAIYTSQQQINRILGLINGSPFTAGPLFVDSAEEQWCTYYPESVNVVPFRVYYKDCLIVQPLAEPFFAELGNKVNSEFLYAMHPTNENPGWFMEFTISSSDKELFDPTANFYLRRRSIDLINHPKTYTEWLHKVIGRNW